MSETRHRTDDKDRTLHRCLESGSSCLGYRIPELGGAEMYVIDAEKVHVLDVPGKRSSPHPKVQVRQVHAGKAVDRGGQET